MVTDRYVNYLTLLVRTYQNLFLGSSDFSHRQLSIRPDDPTDRAQFTTTTLEADPTTIPGVRDQSNTTQYLAIKSNQSPSAHGAAAAAVAQQQQSSSGTERNRQINIYCNSRGRPESSSKRTPAFESFRNTNAEQPQIQSITVSVRQEQSASSSSSSIKQRQQRHPTQ